jgi:hypothetical protein
MALSLTTALAIAALSVPPSASGPGRCDPQAALYGALQLQLPEVPIRPGPPLQDDLAARLSFDGRRWTLQLLQPDGAPALERRLEGRGDECVDMANAAAVIVDRFVTGLGWKREPPLLEPLASPTLPPPALEPLAPAPFLRAVSAGVGMMARLPSTGQAAPAFELYVAVRPWGWSFLEVGAGAAATQQATEVIIQDRPRGTLLTRPGSAWAATGGCTAGPLQLEACAGLFGAAFWLRGEAEGNVYQKSPRWVIAPQAGLLTGLHRRLSSSVELSVSGRVGTTLTRPAVVVEGTAAQHAPPLLEAQAGLRLGWVKSF